MVVTRISCGVQSYAWGKKGSDSAVAKLSKNAVKNFSVDEESPYAELWMGIHPKAPASMFDSTDSLTDVISKDKTAQLGQKIMKHFDQLPFLLKVLSVDRALSIQAHPNKSAAEILHAKDPAHYPDNNHKPEMCIALTDFTGMCGFRPPNETANFVRIIPELAALIGHQTAQNLQTAARSTDKSEYSRVLKEAFGNLMRSEKSDVQAKVSALVSRIETKKESKICGEATSDDLLGDLVLTLNKDFPGDVGIFVIYFLNHVTLKPGEAMFLRANLPHAYLSGNCVECMACSDNVVRAGLTPKFMDVETLVEMLDYSTGDANAFKFTAESNIGGIARFNPDIPDFAVDQISCAAGGKNTSSVESASITLITEGSGKINGTEYAAGSVIFASSGESLEIKAESKMVAYRAFVA